MDSGGRSVQRDFDGIPIAKVENPARQHGVTIATVANRDATIPELQQTTVVMRAQAYRRNLFAQLDGVKDLLTL